MLFQVTIQTTFAAIAVSSCLIGKVAGRKDGKVHSTTVPGFLDITTDFPTTIVSAVEVGDADFKKMHEAYVYGTVKKYAYPHDEYGRPVVNGLYGQGTRYHIGAPETRNR